MGKRDDPVAKAMQRVDRRAFLPADQRYSAGRDHPLPIGYGQTNSQPTTVRNMLRLLDVRPGMRILDVGSGSGWTAALLADLTGPEGSIVGVERVADLVSFARARLDEQRVRQVPVHQAEEGVLGWPGGAPYDRILVSAGATELPGSLVDQLADGGVLVVVVGGVLLRIARVHDGESQISEHGHYRFVPLIGG